MTPASLVLCEIWGGQLNFVCEPEKMVCFCDLEQKTDVFGQFKG